jgi:hypothetical protein
MNRCDKAQTKDYFDCTYEDSNAPLAHVKAKWLNQDKINILNTGWQVLKKGEEIRLERVAKSQIIVMKVDGSRGAPLGEEHGICEWRFADDSTIDKNISLHSVVCSRVVLLYYPKRLRS